MEGFCLEIQPRDFVYIGEFNHVDDFSSTSYLYIGVPRDIALNDFKIEGALEINMLADREVYNNVRTYNNVRAHT